MNIIANNVVSKLFVAFVATAMLFTLATPAKAMTEAEMQAKIAELTAMISALQGGSSSSSSSSSAACTFTRALTVGSQGADVKCLQDYLTPMYFKNAGGSTGYFGSVTASAVAAWQTANGVSPAAGYFGPVSQAKYSAMMAMMDDEDMDDEDSDSSDDEDEDSSDEDDEDDSDNGPLDGEASLDDVDMKSGDDTDIEEGQEDAVVAEMDLDFTDGDGEITRIDLAFVRTSSNPGEDPWDTFEDISLWVDGDEVARMSASDKDDYLDEDDGSIRISGLDIVGREDDTVTVGIAVTPQNGIDNLDATWRVDVDAIRYVDGDDVSTTDTSTGDIGDAGTSFDIEEEGGEDELKLRTSTEDPESTTLELEDDQKSDWQTVFVFDLDTEDSTNDIEITDLPVALITSGATATTAFVNDVQLVVDGEEYDDFTAQGSGSARTYIFDFDSSEFVIPAGERVTVEVQVEFNQLGVGDEGTTIYGTASSTLVDAEGADDLVVGDQITGTVTGDVHSMRTSGLVVEFVDDTSSKSFTADDAGESDIGQFEIEFTVEAFEDDVYLDRTVTADPGRDGSGAAGSGFQWATTTDSTTGTTSTAATISADDTDSQDTATLYYLAEGEKRTFTLKVNLEAGTDGSAGVMLTGINFTTTAGDSSAAQFHTSGLEDFKTTLQSLNKI